MQNSSQARQHIDRFLGEHYLRLRMDEVQHIRMNEVRINSWSDRADRLLMDAGIERRKGLKQCGKGWTGTKPPGCKRATPAQEKSKNKMTESIPTSGQISVKNGGANSKPCGKGWTGTKPPGCKRVGQTENKSAEKNVKNKSSAAYSTVEDKNILARLTPAWDEKIKIYDAILEIPKSEEALKRISDYKKRIDRDFGNNEFIPISRLTIPISATAQQYPKGIDKKGVLSILDGMESNHKNVIEAYKKQIKNAGVNPQKLNMDRVSDNLMILNLLLDLTANKRSKMIGIVSDNGRLQSLLSWRERTDSIEINLLATAPENLDPGDPNRTKGGGTRAIVAAIRKSKEVGKDGAIALTALSGAESFYESLGFKKQGKAQGFLTLDKNAAEEVLRKYGEK